MVTTASSADGSNSMRFTLPMVTPDMETGARARRLPTLSKRAVISNVSSAEKSSPPVVCVDRKNNAPIPSNANRPVPSSTVRVCCMNASLYRYRGDHEIEDQHHDSSVHNRSRRRASDTFGGRNRIIAFPYG